MGAPPHWMGYVGTPDVDKASDHAVRLGGRIVVPPRDIPKVGRWSLLSDPTGATLAAYQPADSPPPTADPEIGDFSRHELATTDPEAAWRFYETLYGWKRTQSMDMGSLGLCHLFMADAHQGGGLFAKPPEMPVSCWLFNIRVADLDGALARCAARGGRVVGPPQEVPGGDRVALCLAPRAQRSHRE